MPNGDPDGHLTELPKLERFFAPLAREIQEFASKHNVQIEQYYHQAPDWRLGFTPPQCGNAAIDIRRVDDGTFILYKLWFVDDYGAGTRSSKRTASGHYRVGEVVLTEVLREALAEILSWADGEWSEIMRGYERIWHKRTREQFESMSPRWPNVRPPLTSS